MHILGFLSLGIRYLLLLHEQMILKFNSGEGPSSALLNKSLNRITKNLMGRGKMHLVLCSIGRIIFTKLSRKSNTLQRIKAN